MWRVKVSNCLHCILDSTGRPLKGHSLTLVRDMCSLAGHRLPKLSLDRPIHGEVGPVVMTAGQAVDDCPGSGDRLDGIRRSGERAILG